MRGGSVWFRVKKKKNKEGACLGSGQKKENKIRAFGGGGGKAWPLVGEEKNEGGGLAARFFFRQGEEEV